MIKHVAMLSVPYNVIQGTLEGRYNSAEEMLNVFGNAFMKNTLTTTCLVITAPPENLSLSFEFTQKFI
ncbi:MAG: hypothetical protein QW338_05400 [Conexivisphaerales archaeon]